MPSLVNQSKEIEELVCYQLKQHWPTFDSEIIHNAMPKAVAILEEGFKGLPNHRFYDNGAAQFSPYMSVQWMIFLYRLSHEIYKGGYINIPKEADQIYYLNKVMHSNDWFYAIDLPVHFLCEHPLGSVLGRAKYGDYLFVYQGTTIGGNRSKGKLSYPVLGDNVILFANSKILGNCHIGTNVVIAAGTSVINQSIPDNSIVFGSSPNIVIKKKSESEIKSFTQHIWGWR